MSEFSNHIENEAKQVIRNSSIETLKDILIAKTKEYFGLDSTNNVKANGLKTEIELLLKIVRELK